MKIMHLEVLLMSNGEIICDGKTIGWKVHLGKYLSVPELKTTQERKDNDKCNNEPEESADLTPSEMIQLETHGVDGKEVLF